MAALGSLQTELTSMADKSEFQEKRSPLSMEAYRQLTELLSKDGYRLAARYFQWHRVEAGRTLWEENAPQGFLALIVSGKVESLKETEFGRPFVTGLYSAGTVVGEDGFLSGRPRHATVKAVARSELLTISRDDFERLAQEQPALAVKILACLNSLLSGRLHNAMERLATVF